MNCERSFCIPSVLPAAEFAATDKVQVTLKKKVESLLGVITAAGGTHSCRWGQAKEPIVSEWVSDDTLYTC